MGLVMNKYQREPSREEDVYLVDYLQQTRGYMSLYDKGLILISLGTFLVISLLYFMLINYVIIFNRCVWVVTLGYLISFTVIVYNSIKKYQHRSDELSRYLRAAFDNLRLTFLTVKQVRSLFLILCMIIMFIFFQVSLYVIVFNNLGITAESSSSSDGRFVLFGYALLLLFNLGGVCSLYSVVIIMVCIFVKVKKVLSSLF